MQPLTHEQLGLIAVHLALTFPVWVRRRKTSYKFVDDTTIRQRQSVDFHLLPRDKFPAKAQPRAGQTIYVPLWIGDKSPLVKFSVVDECGTALSLLNADESTRIAVDGVSAIVRGLNAGRGDEGVDPDAQREALKEIFTAPRDRAEQLAKEALAIGSSLDGALRVHNIYRSLVLELATGLLMLVPITYTPGADRVLKMEHDSPQAWDSVRSKYVVSRVALRVLASLSLVDKHQGFHDLPIGWAQSTHLEFEPPEDVNLGVARLDCEQWDARRSEPLYVARRQVVSGQPAVDLDVRPRVEMDPHEPDDAKRNEMLKNLLAARQDKAEVLLRLGPSISNVVTPSVIASVATVAVLWLALARLGDLDGETSAALLLLFPATAAAFLARPGEHAFATRLLKGVRWSAALVAVCAVVTVGVISGGLIRPEPPPRDRATMVCRSLAPVSPDGTRQRLTRARLVRCRERRRAPVQPPVRAAARMTVMWAAITASVITFTMAIAMVLTHVKVRRRRKASPEMSLDGVPLSSR